MAICHLEKVVIKLNKSSENNPEEGWVGGFTELEWALSSQAGCQVLQQGQPNTVVTFLHKKGVSEQWGWTTRFIKERGVPAQPVLTRAQPTWWHVLPSPSVIRDCDALLTNRLAGAQIPVSSPNTQHCWDGALGSTKRRNAAARAANAEETRKTPTLGGLQGCTRATERHLQTLETKNFNTEEEAQVVRQAASQTPCAINQLEDWEEAFLG